MKELNQLKMEVITGGRTEADGDNGSKFWCGSISIVISIISLTNPIAGTAAGIMWTAACWWLG